MMPYNQTCEFSSGGVSLAWRRISMSRQEPSSSCNFHVFAPITVNLHFFDNEPAPKSSICKYTLIVTAFPVCDRKSHVFYFDILHLHFSFDPGSGQRWDTGGADRTLLHSALPLQIKDKLFLYFLQWYRMYVFFSLFVVWHCSIPTKTFSCIRRDLFYSSSLE